MHPEEAVQAGEVECPQDPVAGVGHGGCALTSTPSATASTAVTWDRSTTTGAL